MMLGDEPNWKPEMTAHPVFMDYYNHFNKPIKTWLKKQQKADEDAWMQNPAHEYFLSNW